MGPNDPCTRVRVPGTRIDGAGVPVNGKFYVEFTDTTGTPAPDRYGRWFYEYNDPGPGSERDALVERAAQVYKGNI